ncbi:hypothetical protein I4182_02600 [Klebsiella pneumoniae]|nr:hypothetical protein [Klebsiella pneumoniae]
MPVTEEQNVLSMLKNNALATTSKTKPEALQEAMIWGVSWYTVIFRVFVMFLWRFGVR